MARPKIGEGKKQQPECPDCGDAYGRYNEKVWANDGEIPVRTYSCPNGCGTFMTMEVAIPKGETTMFGLDENFRTRRAAALREKFGYQRSGVRGNPYLSSDRLIYNVRVHKAARRRSAEAPPPTRVYTRRATT